MRLGVKGRYAVTALVDLSQQPQNDLVTLSDIARRQSLPVPYLEQLFVKLRKAGLVESARGAKGGYRLAKQRSQIHVGDIVSAVEEGLTFTACASKKGCTSPSARCLTHHLWSGLDTQVRNYLDHITLEDVCENRVGTGQS